MVMMYTIQMNDFIKLCTIKGQLQRVQSPSVASQPWRGGLTKRSQQSSRCRLTAGEASTDWQATGHGFEFLPPSEGDDAARTEEENDRTVRY